MKKLNVGSGNDIKPKKEGWTNLDLHKRLGADIIFDLNDIYKEKKMPFKDGEFDYILCSHVLEDFIDPIPIMDELVRITKPGGILEIRVPYETCTWDGIFHKRPFNIKTFFMYVNRGDYEKEKMPIRVKKARFYTPRVTLRGFIWSPITTPLTLFFVNLFNILIKIKYDFVDKSILKLLAQGTVYIRLKYEKLESPLKDERSLWDKIIFRLKR